MHQLILMEIDIVLLQQILVRYSKKKFICGGFLGLLKIPQSKAQLRITYFNYTLKRNNGAVQRCIRQLKYDYVLMIVNRLDSASCYFRQGSL